MKYITLSISLLAVFVLGGIDAVAQIEVKETDVKNGTFVYRLSGADIKSESFLEPAASSSSNIVGRTFGRDAEERVFAVARPGRDTAELVYKFDFSASKHRPTNMNITDNLYLFDGEGGLAEQDVVATTAWSVDGESYTNIREVSTGGTDGNRSSAGTKTIDLPDGVSAVYYRVTFSGIEGKTFVSDQNQWARGPLESEPFVVEFSMARKTP